MFGSGGKVNVETWKCIHTLNSHEGDVLDLAWAPHDGWLASGSVDNTVIIWNTQKFPEKVAVLKGHTGMVKVISNTLFTSYCIFVYLVILKLFVSYYTKTLIQRISISFK